MRPRLLALLQQQQQRPAMLAVAASSRPLPSLHASIASLQPQTHQYNEQHLRLRGGVACCATSSESSGGGGQSTTAPPAPPNIKKLASMAHLAVTDQEVAEWEPKIASIVEW